MKPFRSSSDSVSAEPGLFQAVWFRRLLSLCVVLLVVAGCIEAFRRADRYGKKVVEAKPIPVRIMIANPPGWLAEPIVLNLRDEAYAYVQRDKATTARAFDVLDSSLLNELAINYTGTEILGSGKDAKTVDRWTVGNNAWIKRITEVRRRLNPMKTEQTIEILAEWRRPFCWVRHADTLVLIDAEGVRLPGEYAANDQEVTNGLMVVTGVDLPAGTREMPLPSQPWQTPDLQAGMKLADLLQRQRFVNQIAAIDMANFHGRKDANKAWIELDTIFNTEDGHPRVVEWGRPIGEETFYEVAAAAKMKSLQEVYLRFNRIDANRDYVDVRWEQVRLPKLAADGSQGNGSTPPQG